MNIKQIIVIRKDLGMRRGKEIAQGCHASMSFLTRKLNKQMGFRSGDSGHQFTYPHQLWITQAEIDWLDKGFKKVCVRVNSEKELREIHEKALANGLESHIIEDEGLTEFGGVKTATAVAIGPDYDERIDPITKHLELY